MAEALKLLGLIYRAKKLVLGEDVLENLDRVKLVIIASDTSIKNKDRYLKKCYFYNIDYVDKFNSFDLSNAIGKNNVKLIGVIDEGFKETFIKKMKEDQ